MYTCTYNQYVQCIYINVYTEMCNLMYHVNFFINISMYNMYVLFFCRRHGFFLVHESPSLSRLIARLKTVISAALSVPNTL